MHQKQTRQLFLKNGVFQVVFHVVSLLVFDSIFQKNEMRNEMKNESKTVTVNDTITWLMCLKRPIGFFQHIVHLYKNISNSWLWLVMQTAQLGAIESLFEPANKLAPDSKLLRLAQAMPQVLEMSDLLDSFKTSENVIKHCLQGPSSILNVYFCILLARAILQACFVIGTRR